MAQEASIIVIPIIAIIAIFSFPIGLIIFECLRYTFLAFLFISSFEQTFYIKDPTKK